MVPCSFGCCVGWYWIDRSQERKQIREQVMMVTHIKLVAIETGLWAQPTHFADEENVAQK